MKKASTILLWISLGFGLLYVIATVIGAVIGGATAPIGTPASSVYMIGLIYHIVKTALPWIGRIIFVVIILFGMKSMSENILAEIIAIILYAGGGFLVTLLINSGASVIIGQMMGSEELASFSYMNMGANWGGVLGNISATLFLVGVSFAIAYKKVELADLRRIIEDEEA